MDKFANFGPVYYINLDDSPERKDYVQTHFAERGITRYERVSAIDGRKGLPAHLLAGSFPARVDQVEAACAISHLKAVQQFLRTSTDPYAIICEDDVDLSLARFWPFDWNFALSNFPYDWDCLQLAITAVGDFKATIHDRLKTNFCAACYAITRHHAEKVCRMHVQGERYKLDNGVRPEPTSEQLLFNSGKTYSLPLVSFRIDMTSTIHADHVDRYHKPNRDGLWKWWENHGKNLAKEKFFSLS